VKRIQAQSKNAVQAQTMLEGVQHFFVRHLNELSLAFGENQDFEPVEWMRDEGLHGGGVRYVATDASVFNRASVNYSQVHYDDDVTKKLSSATAISTIIHPRNPHAPSMHMHISWTEMRDGKGYWRIMADLNPSIAYDEDISRFESTLQQVGNPHYELGSKQGQQYFYIPALGRHRGVSHFYLEEFHSGDFDADISYAKQFGEGIVETYCMIVSDALKNRLNISEEDLKLQKAYHTLYLLQVLTLDRGTTSGLLIHDQNDVGILGSLPSHIDKALLQSWVGQLSGVQNELLQNIVDVVPDGEISEEWKKALAEVVRHHYRTHPDALALQASGHIVPDTVNNHL